MENGITKRLSRASRAFRHVKRLGGPREYLFRWATTPLRAAPRFLIVGAQKGGTTSLYEYLSAHPQMLPAAKKEVHYFDRHFDRGAALYRRYFPLKATLRRQHAITGEATPYYLFHPHAAQRIAALLPDVRLILLLRNPVDRAISHYWHMSRRGREPLPMEEAFRREMERLDDELTRMLEDEHYFSYNHRNYSYLSRGIYADQLVRYFEHFDRSQFLILQSEVFFRDSQATYDAVLRFLGLEPRPLPPLPPRNVGRYRDVMPADLREELTAYFRPHNERLYDLLGLDAPWW